ncbi:tellurite resistance TerB family protein [Microbulbifer yueqingensis]|uniref:Uncharacterized protein n=1 Tax=Microbulbifer yueqingensis TaxID=658219 RepID=A0A1G9EL84_9GAMM|nr:tellurite resistance TerB family protein [Microbulbifer yueqingensis]SDK76791.1 Protein of unknown function [Microbulbifer yueqingensis]
MRKKLLLGALLGAGTSMLHRRLRGRSLEEPGDSALQPDLGRVPPPVPGRAGTHDAAPAEAFAQAGEAAGTGQRGTAMLVDTAQRVMRQVERDSGCRSDPNDILGEVFSRRRGKFTPGGAGGPGGNRGGWASPGKHMFAFAESDGGGRGEQQADVLLQAMVAAAQADGPLAEEERQNITGTLAGELEDDELEEFRRLLAQPVDMDGVVARVNDPGTALNIYLVTAMTIDENNPREKAHLDTLAAVLGLSETATDAVGQQLGGAT